MAEITLSHLLQLANEHGCSVSRKQALAFLNQQGRAFEMWKQMMLVGEDFIARRLFGQCISHECTSDGLSISIQEVTDLRGGTLVAKRRCFPKTSSSWSLSVSSPSLSEGVILSHQPLRVSAHAMPRRFERAVRVRLALEMPQGGHSAQTRAGILLHEQGSELAER